MTLGDKIRKYRILKNLSQKELGMKVGFSAATADSRIRKYEKNLMAPKIDIRSAIAEALDIDLAAISDINVNSFEDIMYILFEWEDKLGMDIEKYDGKTYLTLDDNNKEIATLISYINLWMNQKNHFFQTKKILPRSKKQDTANGDLNLFLMQKNITV